MTSPVNSLPSKIDNSASLQKIDNYVTIAAQRSLKVCYGSKLEIVGTYQVATDIPASVKQKMASVPQLILAINTLVTSSYGKSDDYFHAASIATHLSKWQPGTEWQEYIRSNCDLILKELEALYTRDPEKYLSFCLDQLECIKSFIEYIEAYHKVEQYIEKDVEGRAKLNVTRTVDLLRRASYVDDKLSQFRKSQSVQDDSKEEEWWTTFEEILERLPASTQLIMEKAIGDIPLTAQEETELKAAMDKITKEETSEVHELLAKKLNDTHLFPQEVTQQSDGCLKLTAKDDKKTIREIYRDLKTTRMNAPYFIVLNDRAWESAQTSPDLLAFALRYFTRRNRKTHVVEIRPFDTSKINEAEAAHFNFLAENHHDENIRYVSQALYKSHLLSINELELRQANAKLGEQSNNHWHRFEKGLYIAATMMRHAPISIDYSDGLRALGLRNQQHLKEGGSDSYNQDDLVLMPLYSEYRKQLKSVKTFYDTLCERANAIAKKKTTDRETKAQVISLGQFQKSDLWPGQEAKPAIAAQTTPTPKPVHKPKRKQKKATSSSISSATASALSSVAASSTISSTTASVSASVTSTASALASTATTALSAESVMRASDSMTKIKQLLRISKEAAPRGFSYDKRIKGQEDELHGGILKAFRPFLFASDYYLKGDWYSENRKETHTLYRYLIELNGKVMMLQACLDKSMCCYHYFASETDCDIHWIMYNTMTPKFFDELRKISAQSESDFEQVSWVSHNVNIECDIFDTLHFTDTKGNNLKVFRINY